MALKLDHLTICVSDWDAYERHYGTLLPLIGFERVDFSIWRDDAGFFLQFAQAHEGTRPYERYGPGLNHWGLAMPSPESVAALREALIAAGIEAQPLQSLGGATALFLPDPDGLRAEFTYTRDEPGRLIRPRPGRDSTRTLGPIHARERPARRSDLPPSSPPSTQR